MMLHRLTRAELKVTGASKFNDGDTIAVGKYFINIRKTKDGRNSSLHSTVELFSGKTLSCWPVGELAHEDGCNLFLWATCPLLDQAIRVIAAWGFTYSTVGFVWVKMNPGRFNVVSSQTQAFYEPLKMMDELTFFGPGFYTASNTELVLLAWKNNPLSHANGVKKKQVVYAPRREHSRKPDDVQERIEAMYPVEPRIELFARRSRAGWDALGNEVDCEGER